MFDDGNPKECFEWVRKGPWTWFVTLKYPFEITPKYKADRYSPDEAFKVWVDEMRCQQGGGNPYVRVIEDRGDGDILFHVLLQDVPEGWWQRHWKWRWYQLSAGSAWDRRLDDRVEGLIKFFFFKIHCDIEYGLTYETTFCRARKGNR